MSTLTRVLVTGASRGIGAAVALKLGRLHGPQLRIALAGRRPGGAIEGGAIEGVAAELRALGASVVCLAGDLGDPEVPARLVQDAAAFCGGLDSVVANAGITSPAPLAELALGEWERLFAVNTRAPWLLAKAAHGTLVDSLGTFVAVASASGMVPHPDMGAYSASKAALIMLCRQLAQEWGPDGIRVNSVSPGMIRTPLTEPIYRNPEIAAARNRTVPLRRVGTPEDVADAVAFLLGPGSAFLTGQNLSMDGGYTDSSLGRIPGLPRSA